MIRGSYFQNLGGNDEKGTACTNEIILDSIGVQNKTKKIKYTILILAKEWNNDFELLHVPVDRENITRM